MYEDELVAELQRVSDKPAERSQYILMERLRPPITTNYLVKHDEDVPTKCDTVSELGVFGYYLRYGVSKDYIPHDVVSTLLQLVDVQTTLYQRQNDIVRLLGS